MFLEIDKKPKEKTAIKDTNNSQVTYGAVTEFAQKFAKIVERRTLLFVLCSNCAGAAVGYLGAMINHAVPLMLGANMDRGLLEELIRIYKPRYLWKPDQMVEKEEKPLLRQYGYVLVSTGFATYPLYEDLALLLTTSGSTGSPKLVRHSYMNLEAQARNISAFFELSPMERPLLDLPIQYTYGLSILNSHLYSGGTVLLSALNILNPSYWEYMKKERCTSFTNVPYAYEILKKLRFFNMELPDLKVLSQGGGKLNENLQKEFAEYAERTGKRFIVTYGQTEGSARMAYLPAEYAKEKTGSIGRAIPNGHLFLRDEDGREIVEPGVVGEMIYQGPNVTLGYACSAEDLQLGDERHGELPTGDMAKKDEDGFFYIVGRKKRFLKLCGFRVGLDECENIIKSVFDTECACVGNDQCMTVYVTTEKEHDKIKHYIADKTNLNSAYFEIRYIEHLPRNEAGKVLYSKLQ